MSAKSEAQAGRRACVWAQRERALEGEGEKIHADVMAQSLEGDSMDSLWRVMNVIEGGQGTGEEVKKVRDRVVATVEERWKAGELKEPLPSRKPGGRCTYRRWYKGEGMGGRRRARLGRRDVDSR